MELRKLAFKKGNFFTKSWQKKLAKISSDGHGNDDVKIKQFHALRFLSSAVIKFSFLLSILRIAFFFAKS